MLSSDRPNELADLLAQGSHRAITQRLSGLLMVAEGIFFYADLGGGSVTPSRSAEIALGYGPDAVGRSLAAWRRRVHREDVRRVVSSAIGAMRGHADVWAERLRIARADGTYAPVRVRASIVREGGRAVGLMGSLEVEEGAEERDELRRQIDDLLERLRSADVEEHRRELVNLAVADGGGLARVIGARSLAGAIEGPATGSRPVVYLTHRQAQVLELVRGGYTNKEIGGRLGFSEQSAKEHVSHLLQKFGAPNRAALVAAADAARVERERRARGHDLLDEIDVMFGVVRGPDHVVVAASPRLLRLTPVREVVGRSVRDAYPELSGHGIFEVLDHVYRTGERHEAERVLAGVEDATGSSVVVHFRLEPIVDTAGRVDGLLVLGLDVTPRGRAGSSVLDALRRQVESIGDAPVGAVVVDGTGRLLAMNPQARQRLGGTLDGGRPVPEYATGYRLRDEHGRALGPEQTAVARALRGETVSRMDYVLRPPGGSEDVVLRTSAMPIREAGQVVAVILTFTEIERRAAPSDAPPPRP